MSYGADLTVRSYTAHWDARTSPRGGKPDDRPAFHWDHRGTRKHWSGAVEMPTRMIREAMHSSPIWVYGCVTAGKEFLLPLPQFSGWAPKALANVLRCCYTACQLKADDFGNFEANPVNLGSWWRIYGVEDDDIKCIDAVTSALVSVDLLRSYVVGQKRFLHIPRFDQRMRHVHAACPVPPWQQEKFDEVAKNQSLAKKTADARRPDGGRAADGRQTDDGLKLEVRRSKLEAEEEEQPEQDLLSVATALRAVATSAIEPRSPDVDVQHQKAGNGAGVMGLNTTTTVQEARNDGGTESSTVYHHPNPPPAFELQEQKPIAAAPAKPTKLARTIDGREIPVCPAQLVADRYNLRCAKGCGGRGETDGMAKAKPVVADSKRHKVIHKRWAAVFRANVGLVTEADGLRYFDEVFSYAASIDFLMGRSSRDFVANLDWMLDRDDAFTKIDERGWKNSSERKSLFGRGGEKPNHVGGGKLPANAPWMREDAPGIKGRFGP